MIQEFDRMARCLRASERPLQTEQYALAAVADSAGKRDGVTDREDGRVYHRELPFDPAVSRVATCD